MSTVPSMYVYENNEVKLTGRVAEKKLRSGTLDRLVEISPVEGTWTKWVNMDELYEVFPAPAPCEE